MGNVYNAFNLEVGDVWPDGKIYRILPGASNKMLIGEVWPDGKVYLLNPKILIGEIWPDGKIYRILLGTSNKTLIGEVWPDCKVYKMTSNSRSIVGEVRDYPFSPLPNDLTQATYRRGGAALLLLLNS